MSSICPKCGKFMESDVCEFCQNSIESKELLEKQKKREQFSVLKKKLVLSAGIIVGIAVVFAVLLIIMNISSSNNSSSNNYHKNKSYNSYETYENADVPNGNENTNNESEETNDTSYYSCLTQDGDGLKFNVTPQEFLERYNSLKSSYEDDNYGDIELSDFYYIEEGTNVNGTSGEAYGCSKTIMGEFSDLIICINQENNGNSILSVNFGIKNNKWTNMYYSDEMVTKIMTQYELLICAITGCDMSTATDYTVKMLKDDTKSTYDRGILFNVDTTNSKAHWYRIQPCTREQYDSAFNGEG